MEFYLNGGQVVQGPDKTITLDERYFFKMRVETIEGVGGLYSLKAWHEDDPEPSGWDVTAQEAQMVVNSYESHMKAFKLYKKEKNVNSK